jgi:hypothetical protein
VWVILIVLLVYGVKSTTGHPAHAMRWVTIAG